MKFEYSGRHIEVTPALRSHVEGHFKRIEHIFRGKPIKVHVIIEVERGRHRSEIVVNWRNDVLTATTRNSDMYRSLSASIDKIEKQALKLKNKVIDRSHRATKVGTITRRTAELKPAPASPRIIPARRTFSTRTSRHPTGKGASSASSSCHPPSYRMRSSPSC